MALRDKLAANAQRFLEPGEQIQAVMGGQTKTGWLNSGIMLLFNNMQAVVATDRRIVVFDCGKLAMTKPKSINRVLPRSTRIGPASGLWWRCDSLGPKIYIHKRFHKDVDQADALRPQA